MELLEGIQTRHSTRAFLSTPIPPETIKTVLEAAGKSPSYTNSQPWEVAVVTGKKRDELSKILRDLANREVAFNPDITHPVTWPPEIDKRLKEHHARRFAWLGIDREDKAGRKAFQLTNYDFFGAPCALFLMIDSTLTTYSIFDMGLFAQSIALAAHSFGVGTCLQASIVRYPDAVRQVLALPATKRLIIGISMGYPDPKARINAYHAQKTRGDSFVKWYA